MIIVIAKDQQATANQWMKDNVDPIGGEFTFTIPLYTGGELTHYWCSINMTDEQRDMATNYFDNTYDLSPQDVLNNLGLNTGNESEGGI